MKYRMTDRWNYKFVNEETKNEFTLTSSQFDEWNDLRDVNCGYMEDTDVSDEFLASIEARILTDRW